MKSYFTGGTFARELGYASGQEKGFRKLVNELAKKNIVEIQQGGFRGDSIHHPKIIVVKDWISLLLCLGVRYESPKTPVYPKLPRNKHVPKKPFWQYPKCNYLRPCKYKTDRATCKIDITCNQRQELPTMN